MINETKVKLSRTILGDSFINHSNVVKKYYNISLFSLKH